MTIAFLVEHARASAPSTASRKAKTNLLLIRRNVSNAVPVERFAPLMRQRRENNYTIKTQIAICKGGRLRPPAKWHKLLEQSFCARYLGENEGEFISPQRRNSKNGFL